MLHFHCCYFCPPPNDQTPTIGPNYIIFFSKLVIGFFLFVLLTKQQLYLKCIHFADAFIQSDLQLLYMSEVARLWSN